MANPIRIESDLNLLERFSRLSWGLIFLVCLIGVIGALALYSAGGGSLSPWASKHIIRFGIGFAGMFIVAMIDTRWWYRLAWPIYFAGFLMLVIVEVKGHVGMGAQRWIDLGFMKLQPSEFMKIAVVLALARYFHSATLEDVRRLTFLIPAAFIILAPVGLVLLQPDLGTSLMIMCAGISVFFVAGAPLWLFIGGIVLAAGSVPVAWQFLHDYQKQRVLTFLNPESDPLGAGYHITQSKIALGSGGLKGKGFLEGSQSHLNFLPEKQTDFIFTLWAEEWGFLGAGFLLLLFAFVFMYGPWIAWRVRQNFSRYLVIGLMMNFSLYVFINVSMVMGLIPVVGAPLPLISYGGTAMLATLVGFGLIMSAHIYRDSKVTRV